MIVYMTHDEDKGLLFTMQTEREWMTLTIVSFDSALSSMNHLMLHQMLFPAQAHMYTNHIPHTRNRLYAP